MTHPPAIQITDLHASYGANIVLRGINETVPEKAITAIIGASGCGKSTLLRCLNRLNEENEDFSYRGKIYLAGETIESMPVSELRRKVGMVFQKPNPFPLSIMRNLTFGLAIHQLVPKAEYTKRVEHWLRAVHLWDEVHNRLNMPATRLSGGQQQRLCLARCLAIEPSVILLDEPCASLDPVATEAIEALLHQLRQRYTIVIVTHSLAQARRLADKVIFMHNGQIIESGTPTAIFTAPREPRTKDYVTGRSG